MNLRIALDANEANIEKRVGTGQYTYQLLTRFAKTDYDFHCYLRRPPLSDLPVESANWHYHVIGPQKAWTRFALPLRLAAARGRYRVFWNPAHYLPPFAFTKSVVTIHDLAYEFFPELFLPADLYKLKNWTRQSVKQADKIIAVSEATKADLIRLYAVPEKKIVVINNGFDADFFNPQTKCSSQILVDHKLIPKNYLLFVGTLQPRKNIIKLVQAFRLLKEDGYSGKLVIAGNIGWLAEETLKTIKSSPDAKDIVMTGYISDEARLSLYRHADVFVLPSLYEGFGVPVLEAMSCGAPVVASNNSSLPEVVGKAGLLFDPADPADIARAVKEIKKDRKNFIEKGLQHASHYSWDKCAKQTLETLLETTSAR